MILDIQRAGPSTGMPTKPEQGDLLMVLFGRNGESPVPVVAASTPAQCFDAAIEAARIALKYRTPVFLLSDAYLANGSEPWLLPDVSTAARHLDDFATQPNARRRVHAVPARPGDARAAVGGPGTPASSTASAASRRRTCTGNISYDPDNHDLMVAAARAEGRGHRGRHPRARGRRPGRRAKLLVLGWGGTYGPIAAGIRRIRNGGGNVAHAHLRYLNPFPRNLGEVLRRYDKV